MRTRLLAYGALVLTAALWGSSAVTARGLIDTLPPVALAYLRWSVVLVALRAVRVERTRGHGERACVRDFRTYATLALVGFAPQTCLVYFGLVGSTATVLGLLNSAIPVMIVGADGDMAGAPAASARGVWASRLSLAGRRCSSSRAAIRCALCRAALQRRTICCCIAGHGRVGVLHDQADRAAVASCRCPRSSSPRRLLGLVHRVTAAGRRARYSTGCPRFAPAS